MFPHDECYQKYEPKARAKVATGRVELTAGRLLVESDNRKIKDLPRLDMSYAAHTSLEKAQVFK